MHTLLSADRPFPPRRLPFFYGWVIVFAGTIGIIATIPGQTMGVGPFTESLLLELDLARTPLALAYLVGTIGSSLLLPRVGRAFDQLGVRPVALAGYFLFGLALIYLSQVDQLYHAMTPGRRPPALVGEAGGTSFHWLPAVGGSSVIAWPLIALGYFLIRFLGQGTLTMICRAMLGKWFNRQRGIVSALNGAVTSAGFGSSPALLYWLIENLGHGGTWLLLGGVMIGFMMPFAYVFFRDNPEECGLLMDDPKARREAPASEMPNPEFTIYREMTVKEAGRTYAFWITCLATAFLAFFGTAIPFHAESLAEEAGMPPKEFFELFVKTMPVQITSTFVVGWMCGRLRMKWVLVLMLGAMTIGAFGLTLLPSWLGLALYVAGNGTAWGAFGPVTTVAFPRFFGRKYLGETSGRLMVFMVVASAMGPYAFAWIKEEVGSYLPAAYGFCVLTLALLLASLGAENPQRKIARKQAGS
ncbi:MAG: MFS transporter [Opitutales bacterium]